MNRYLDKLEGVTIVLLPQALFGRGEGFIYNSYNKEITYDESIINCNEQLKRESNNCENIRLADVIRKSIYNGFIKPAKDIGNSEVLVKSSKVHSLLKLNNRYPAVCSAMEGKKIEKEYGIKIMEKEGKYGVNFSVLYKI